MCVTLLSPFNTPIASIYLNHTQTEKKQYAFTTLTMQIVSVMNVTDKENAFAHTHTHRIYCTVAPAGIRGVVESQLRSIPT